MEKKFDHNQYQHVWNYFQLHANQRISLFGYYIIFLSIFAAGAGTIIFRFHFREANAEFLGIIIGILYFSLAILSIKYPFNCEGDSCRDYRKSATSTAPMSILIAK